jgi:hypothetical protein
MQVDFWGTVFNDRGKGAAAFLIERVDPIDGLVCRCCLGARNRRDQTADIGAAPRFRPNPTASRRVKRPDRASRSKPSIVCRLNGFSLFSFVIGCLLYIRDKRETKIRESGTVFAGSRYFGRRNYKRVRKGDATTYGHWCARHHPNARRTEIDVTLHLIDGGPTRVQASAKTLGCQPRNRTWRGLQGRRE